MKKTPLWVGVCLCPLFSQVVHAEFLADSKAELTLRNFYFDRDYKKIPILIQQPEIGRRV